MGYKWISDPISVEVFNQGIGFQIVDIPGIEVPVPSGARGLPGYSPTVTVTTTTNGHQVEITDINGTTTFDVLDGEQGVPGVGIAPGGTASQVLAKKTNADYDTEWVENVTSVNGQTGDVTITIPSASTATPADLGTASAGSSANYARADHVHKKPTASDVGALPSNTTYVSTVNGSSGAVTVTVPDAATATPADLGTAAVGSSAKYAREDHVHNLPSVFSTVDFQTFTIAANGSVTITMDSLSGAVVFVSGYQAARNGIIDMGTTSGGNAFYSKVNASSVTVSTSGGAVTVSGGNAVLQCLMIVYAGSASVS